MRDVAPPGPVSVGDVDRVADHGLLRGGPQLAEALDRQLALLSAGGVHGVLEAVHRHLAEHRRDRVLERRREQGESLVRVVDAGEQGVVGDGLAEHRRGLRERQRRRLVERALTAGQVGVQAVAELVGQRQHVAVAAGPVEQQVRVVRRHGVGAERSGALGRPDRGVDPAAVVEALHDPGELGREAGVGVVDQGGGLGPADLGFVLGHRRHAVVVGQAVESQHLGLEAVPALRDVVA